MLEKIDFLRLQSVVKILMEMLGQSFFLSVMQFLEAFHHISGVYYTLRYKNLDG